MTDFININWDTILNIDEANPIVCLNNFSRKAEVIDTYLPLIKLSKKELKIQVKPWIASEIKNSIKQCDKLLRKFIKTRNEELKEELYAKYKNIRNKIVSIIRASKKSHFQQYFIENGNDFKKTWTGIKNIINIHNVSKGQPSSMFINKEMTADPIKTANGFNYYFSIVGNILSLGLSTKSI